MYLLIKISFILIALFGIIYLLHIKNKYNKDDKSKEEIIEYFKDNKAFSVENGISVKELPNFISKNPYLLMMIKDKTLVFKKGKYYLNKK